MRYQNGLRLSKAIAAAAVGGITLLGLAVRAENPEHIETFMGSKQCPGCDLRDSDLRGLNLRGAKLRNARLVDADLREADLQGADLQGADLFRADLRGANLKGANLKGAYLRAATWIDGQKCLDTRCSKRKYNPF